MKKNLVRMNINTLGDLAQADIRALQAKFGVVGVRLKEKLLGFDFDPVANVDDLDPVKSVGNGTTTIKDICTEQEVKQTIQYLACSVSSRLREKGFRCANIGVSIKNASLHTLHHEKTIMLPTNDEIEIAKEAMRIIHEFWEFGEPIRAVRLCCSTLSSTKDNEQTNFFSALTSKADKINAAVDFLNKKYCRKVVKLAAITKSDFINSDSFD